MKPTAWLVQTNIWPESPTPTLLGQACRNHARPYLPINVPPGSKTLPPIPEEAKGRPVVFHGRSTLILNALSSPWRHGVFFDAATFTHEAYAKGFGDLLLNHGAVVLTWEELLAVVPTTSGYRFLKPNDDFKGFTGKAMDLSSVGALFQSLQRSSGQDLLYKEVVVAEAHEVDAEWRIFVVNGEVITGSMYRPTGGSHLPKDVVDFAKSAISVWTPCPVFALDIGKVGRQYKVVECNCFNASRLYDSNVDVLVQAVSKYQEERYESLPSEQLRGMT